MRIRRLWESPTFTTWLSTGTRTAGWLVTLPLVLRTFSPAEVAVWYLFMSILSLQQLGDAGFSPVFVRELAYRRGMSEAERMPAIQRVATSLQWLFGRLALAATTIVAIGGTLALRHPISALEHPMQGWLAWASVLVGFYVALRSLFYGAVLQGMNHVASLRRNEGLVGALSIMSVAAIVLCGGRLLAVSIAAQGWTLIGLLRLRSLALRSGAIAPPLDRPDTALLKELWPSAWRSGLGTGLTRALVVLSGLVYAQWAAAAALASYLLAVRIAHIIVEFSQAPFYSKIPELARLWSTGKRDDLLRMATAGASRSLWTFALLYSVVTLVAPRGLEFIGSSVSWPPASLWALMGAAFFFERVGAMHLQLFSTTNRILWHIANGGAAIINVMTVLLLGPRLGVFAFPAGSLAGAVGFYTWYSARLAYTEFDLSFPNYEARTSMAPAACLFACLGLSILLR